MTDRELRAEYEVEAMKSAQNLNVEFFPHFEREYDDGPYVNKRTERAYQEWRIQNDQ